MLQISTARFQKMLAKRLIDAPKGCTITCLSRWERCPEGAERALSVSFADSSPSGGAKNGAAVIDRFKFQFTERVYFGLGL